MNNFRTIDNTNKQTHNEHTKPLEGKHPAIKGLRPPEHHAGKLHPDQRDSSESKHKGTKSASLDFLRGSSVKIGTIQRRLAWPLRKDDTHKSISVNILVCREH